jgi:cytochrome d ubiquinol oxidase subunit I
MVLVGSFLLLPAAWFLLYWLFRRRLPGNDWFYRLAAIAGVLSVFCIECGWVVTEVGRQPWIVYNFLRTADAVTHAGFARPLFVVVIVLYVAVGVSTILVLRGMSRRWRAGDQVEPPVPYGPPGASVPAPTAEAAEPALATSGED